MMRAKRGVLQNCIVGVRIDSQVVEEVRGSP